MTFWGFDWIFSQSGIHEPWDELQDLVNEYASSRDCTEDIYKLSYYEKLLEDLQQMETEINCSFPKLKDKIKTLNFEVRYIMPYMTCNRVRSHDAYEETKRRFRIEGRPERLIKFVEHMIAQTLLVRPDATNFYHDTRDCNWVAFTDCVLDNLKYAQSLDDSKASTKSIEESLRFVRNFVMVVKRWNFGKLNSINNAKILDIYKSIGSVSRDAALIYQLLMAENFDGLNDAMNLRISEVQKTSNGVSLEAEEAYYDILSLLKLYAPDSCPIKSETLYGLIDSLQKDLMVVFTDLQHVRLSKEEDILDMINEFEFLKSILICLSDGLVDRGKLNAVATHVHVLACEAGSAVYASAGKLELEDHKTQTKFTSLVAKINQTKHELRQTNKKDEKAVHCSIKDFLNDDYFRGRGIRFQKDMEHIYPFLLELDFYQTFFRCTKKWCIDHPHLRVMRVHTEDVVRCAGWDIRSLSFRKNVIDEEVTIEKIEIVLSDMVQKLTLYRPDVAEICAKIRDSKPLSLCRLCKKFGLGFADVQCEILSNMRTCDAKPTLQEENVVLDLAILFRSLHQIAGNLLIGRKSLNGLLTFLEDLIDRAACLSYLQLVDKADRTVSLKVLLDHIEEPKVVDRSHALIECTIWNVRYSYVPRHIQMWTPVNRLIRLLEDVKRTGASVATSMKDHVVTDDSIVKSMKDHVGTVLRDLTVLQCILYDPLIEYYEQQEYDELLTDIGAGIVEAGVFFFFVLVHKSKVNIFFRMKDVVRCFNATVSHVYLKYTKLSPSKLTATEMGSLNILLANLKKMNNSRQIQELHEELQVCNSFLEDSDISSNLDELGMIKCLRTRISSLGCKLANTLDTFDEVPDWFFEMRISSFLEGVKVITEDIEDTKLRLFSDLDSSNQMSPKVEAKPLKSEVIGFEDEEEQLIRQLTTGSRLLEVISIVGMPGSGKTTLAMEVYEAVGGSFHCSAWCYVSQNYQKRGLLLQILNEIEGPSVEIKELSDEDLALKLYQCLMKKKDYLIILDDVWDIEAWNELMMCFPRGNDRNRILLTSRSKDVGLHAASSNDSCISLNLLSTENGRLLLENKIFGARGFPDHLREIGMEIADRCERLPMSLVLMAGVLKNVGENKQEWEQVAQNLNSLVQSQDGVLKTLELSYKHLPDHLKQCFLYCGALMSIPISRGEIRRSKLVQLWVAERLIDETDERGSLDLEEAAEYCLMDLVNRSLVMVSKKAADGEIHSCRVHDLLLDFCIWKGDEEQFLLRRLDDLKPFPWQQRLSICLCKPCKVKHPLQLRLRTRSLIYSECCTEWMSHNRGSYSCIFDSFRLLNVLDLETANMGDDFPQSIIEMNQLRYLAIGGLMNCIPSSINKLSNLETLIIQGGKDGVRIPDTNTVFGLKKLRHLTVSPHVHFNTKSLSPSDCLQLRTLETIRFCCCEACKDAISRLPNLRKLKCVFRGSIRYDGFPSLDSFKCLEYVKATYSGLSPLFFKFSLPILPTNLKKITLSKFELPWSEMEKIAALPHVEYLKLQNGAFSGKKWVTQYEFPSLKYLRLDSLDFEEWEASDDYFPCLERLIVRGCKRLKEIPPEFSDVGTLSCIEIDQCGRSVGDSAIKIEYEQRNYFGNKQFRAIIWRIEEMVFNEEQANKEFYLSCGIFLAFQFVLVMTMRI